MGSLIVMTVRSKALRDNRNAQGLFGEPGIVVTATVDRAHDRNAVMD